MIERFCTSALAAAADGALIDPILKRLIFNLCAAYDELWREYAQVQAKLAEIEATRQAATESIPAKRKRG